MARQQGRKEEFVGLFVDSTGKARYTHASAIMGLTLSEFSRRALDEAATRVIRQDLERDDRR